jgi:hypothetical protein
MWMVAAIVLSVAFVACPIPIEVVRRIMHARRERQRGLGGTQDVAVCGTLIMLGCGILAAICWSIHLEWW